MLLRQIRLSSFLSFGPQTPLLDLGPLNVLIGPNGAGKSNLIEAILLLRATPRELAAPVREGGGVRDWLWKGDPGTPTAVIEAIVDHPEWQQPLRHRIAFTAAGARLEVSDERIEDATPEAGQEKPRFYFGYENGRPLLGDQDGTHRGLKREDLDPEQSILAQRKDPDRYPEITHLGQSYERIKIYREWSFGRYTRLRLPQKADLRNDFLSDSGREEPNLALVLNRLRSLPEAKATILSSLRTLYEGITDFDVIIQGGTVQLFLQEGGQTIPATRLSDGTLRFLSLLSILCHPTPPPLVCIEEPELGLHPDVLPELARLLRRASEHTQLVVTTHSAGLCDALSDTPEAIVVCEKHEARTEMRRLDPQELAPWLERYRLGQLWLRGDLGGTRW
jgi:predicted ATPase